MSGCFWRCKTIDGNNGGGGGDGDDDDDGHDDQAVGAWDHRP